MAGAAEDYGFACARVTMGRACGRPGSLATDTVRLTCGCQCCAGCWLEELLGQTPRLAPECRACSTAFTGLVRSYTQVAAGPQRPAKAARLEESATVAVHTTAGATQHLYS